jgi:Glu-tRNA(Gln) amidotransferase subunit E-like FAD-binding protein
MISIRDSLTELERAHETRKLAVECYVAAIKNMAHCPVDLEAEFTEPFQRYLTAMASEVAEGSTDALIESRATLPGLLREYRENASKFLSDLREELAANARSLEEVMVALAQADGDQAPRLRAALSKLRESVNMPERDSRALVASTPDAIDKSIEEMRHHHQLTISQSQAEVRMLHKRITRSRPRPRSMV